MRTKIVTWSLIAFALAGFIASGFKNGWGYTLTIYAVLSAVAFLVAWVYTMAEVKDQEEREALANGGK